MEQRRGILTDFREFSQRFRHECAHVCGEVTRAAADKAVGMVMLPDNAVVT